MSANRIMSWVDLLPEHCPKLLEMRNEVIHLMAQAGEVSGKADDLRKEAAAIIATYRDKIAALAEEARLLDKEAAKLRERAYFRSCTTESMAKGIWTTATIEQAKQSAA
ncbi:hypothetical protein D3C75_1122590 [compost metagenome]